MGQAGKALQAALSAYGISQSDLAQVLGVERPIVFRWFHGKTDPTGDTITAIVQALYEIQPDAAREFTRAFLGEAARFEPVSILDNVANLQPQQLPASERVDVGALARLFDKTTSSYKYLWFLSLLDILNRRQFDILSPISFQELIIEMLANSWYPHSYFRLSFGVQDQISKTLDSLNLQVTESILNFKDFDKLNLRKIIQTCELSDIIKLISQYVPFRLLHPFFDVELKGLRDHQINQKIVNLSNLQFADRKPLYCFNSSNVQECNSIVLHQDWIKYLNDNFVIVRGWAAWEWLKYMQHKNPSTPNIVSKLFIPQVRGTLIKSSNFWKKIINRHEISCIYSQNPLASNNIVIDHFIPWSFVAHDSPWNLIPTTSVINAKKSNQLPNIIYLEPFVRTHHLSLTIAREILKKKDWNNHIESYISDLRIDEIDLLNYENLYIAYQKSLFPLMSLAKNQGFSENWLYDG